jgi:hypothetical protein
MNKKTVVSVTVTVPAQSTARSLEITTTAIPSTASSAPAQQAAANPKANPSHAIRYAAAVLKGQPDMLESVAPCFVSDNARIKKDEEGWILESSEFAPCITGEEVFPIADDVVSRINHILALYCGFTPTVSVEHIYWIDAEGEKRRTIRGSIPVNVVSSKGLAELKSMSGTQPLGSAVFQAMNQDQAVDEAFTLHGDGELNWSQVYDIIEFFGGVDGILKAGYATTKETRAVRQTANHHRHLGSPKPNPLPSNPPTQAEASEFVRSILKRWISSRL